MNGISTVYRSKCFGHLDDSSKKVKSWTSFVDKIPISIFTLCYQP